MQDSIEQRLTQLGIVLPQVTAPRGSYATYVQSGKTIYLSGKGAPLRNMTNGIPKVGAEVSTAEATMHAREVGIYLIAAMKEALGTFDNLGRVIKVLGMVNATADFTQHTEVINGASDLFVQVFGPEKGTHARSAIGVGSLPKGFAVEIEAIIERI
jgi:enamine deaminase RidA (YjgF/YER057c/UK114 family)